VEASDGVWELDPAEPQFQASEALERLKQSLQSIVTGLVVNFLLRQRQVEDPRAMYPYCSQGRSQRRLPPSG